MCPAARTAVADWTTAWTDASGTETSAAGRTPCPVSRTSEGERQQTVSLHPQAKGQLHKTTCGGLVPFPAPRALPEYRWRRGPLRPASGPLGAPTLATSQHTDGTQARTHIHTRNMHTWIRTHMHTSTLIIDLHCREKTTGMDTGGVTDEMSAERGTLTNEYKHACSRNTPSDLANAESKTICLFFLQHHPPNTRRGRVRRYTTSTGNNKGQSSTYGELGAPPLAPSEPTLRAASCTTRANDGC